MGAKRGKEDGLMPEAFAFMLQAYISLEEPDTEKINHQVGKKQEKVKNTHAKFHKKLKTQTLLKREKTDSRQ